MLASALPAGAIDIALLNDGAAFASQVVAKGDGFLVQSVRFPLLNPLRELRLPNQPQIDQVLLHTALPKGTGRELVRTVTFREVAHARGELSPQPHRGRGGGWERLYVAVWHAKGRGASLAFLLPLEKRLKTKRH